MNKYVKEGTQTKETRNSTLKLEEGIKNRLPKRGVPTSGHNFSASTGAGGPIAHHAPSTPIGGG